MDTKKCEACLMAASLGSFTAAAEELGYTQSGITRMIRSLEDELGFPLFIRGKTGIKLSANGEMLLPALRDIVQADARARELCGEIRGVITGNLTIGSYYSVSAIWMPELLARFKKEYPGIRVRMHEGGNREMTIWLNEHSVDLCFCAKPDKDTVCDWIPVYNDPLTAWLPEKDPAAAADSFPVTELQNRPFIHTSPNQDTDQDRLIKEHHLIMDTRYTTRDAFTTYNMVESGLGISFNQKMISRRWQGRVVEIPLAPSCFVELGLAVPSLKSASPAAGKFIQCVQEWVQNMPDLQS
ncbi:MAG: LysR family transcriptional regulator [Eubacterium sp.]